MPIVYYVILVWLKIIICTSLIFLWLWVARDRGYTGGKDRKSTRLNSSH